MTLLFSSCAKDTAVDIPAFSPDASLRPNEMIPDSLRTLLDGVYSTTDASGPFGASVVIRRNGKFISLVCRKNYTFAVLQAGRRDSSIILEGYWRSARSTDHGLVRLSMNVLNGAGRIMAGQPGGGIQFEGAFGNNANEPSNALILKRERQLSVQTRPFWVIAHRGGGRNSDAFSQSENSLGMIKIAEGFGANAIEIDARLTSDGVPILFHDENFSPRLVNSDYCIGPVANYTFKQIRALCSLKNGEQVPTLREALETVLTETSLSLVWIDTKSPQAVAAIIPLQQEFLARARQQGRTLEILVGLPSGDILDAYKNHPMHVQSPAVCELDMQNVRASNASIWAPRWTLGPQHTSVLELRAEGRRTFFWTIDEQEFVGLFLDNDNADGILTNYPMLIAYEYYSR
ncbi:MAG: glycerophosphodiester phosphodiesterase family protein [Ignavibacteriales bacterium]|nr:glycerophosphodiester phosphodiesterase family protein [Ignavibacteriales bacterium]